MCGIAGYLRARPFAPGTVPSMIAAMRHRGSDAEGYFEDGAYHAGMCRLAINDVAGGDQPLFNTDKSAVLLYNGEIYNYPELRCRLEQKGVRFRTHSDGEVICHLYDEVGPDVFEAL